MNYRAFLGSCVSSMGAVGARVVRPLLILSIVLLATVRSVAPTQAVGNGPVVTECTDSTSFLSAVNTALASPGSTVTFACSGTIPLGTAVQVSQPLTIDGTGQSVTLSGNNATQLFSVSSNLTLDNLTLTGGSASGDGGAVETTTASAAITANNVTFSDNAAAGSGGAIAASVGGGSITVSNSTFTGNTASGGNGGAVSAQGPLTVTNSAFSGNTASNGHSGAINADEPPPPNNPTSIITGSTFTANQAAGGGAVGFGWNNPAAITNSTLTGNSATGDGDAVYTYTSVFLSFDTIAGNTGAGSAIAFIPGSPNYKPGITAAGTILDNATNCSSGGTIVDQGSNLTYGGGNCGLTSASDLQNQDPQLNALASNGGPTQTMAVSYSSPAIGAAACTDTSGNPVTTDQRGVSRPVSACTIGAFEGARSNDTWINALTLNQTSGSYQVNQTVSQHIYTGTEERWYKFSVTPGSQVTVSYQGDPGAVVSLHSDLQAAYNALTTPASAAVQSAQDAPSEFLPSEFLPSEFLPSEFLPSEFLPSEFLPSEFLPSEFLPSEFLPSEFLPSEFLPSEFLPSGYASGPYSGAILGSVLAVSDTPNTTVQTITHDTWNTFGTFYVRVIGPADPNTPFTLTVTETGGVCNGVNSNLTATPPSSYTSIPSGLTSLILWDSKRIAGSAGDISTLSSKLSTFAGRSEVNGTVIDLSQNSGIEAAQAQADNNPACPEAKNIVAGDIKSVIQAYRANNTGLKYIVLVGDDHSIPFFRYPDESGLGPENLYYPPVADSSASNASLRDNFVLGQDEYGASSDVTLGDESLPVPNLAVGRLVSTAAEVSHMLDVYTAANGVITPQSSLVTGYDFVADAACNAEAQLAAGIGATPDTLIQQSAYTSQSCPTQSTPWTANDLSQKLLTNHYDIAFLAGHFSAGNLEAADYSTTLSAAAVASSTVNMSNSLILALGCHGGYNIPGGDAVANLTPTPSWPEAFAEKGATLLAATGYAYGDTVLTEYGEHLFDNVVQQLRSYSGASYSPVPVGQAEVAAKSEYLATHTNPTGIDEKTLLETTLYGLPMLQVNMTGQTISTQPDSSIVGSAPTVSSGPGQSLGLGSADVDVPQQATPHTVTLSTPNNGSVTATYLTGPNNGEVARPGEPIFPSQSVNVHVSNQVLRGVGFRGGTYSDTTGVTPLTSAVGTETSVGHPAFYSPTFYPNQVWGANYFSAINGGAEHLVTTPAQYVSSSPTSASGIMRQFSDLKFRLFYLPSSWTSNSQTAPAAEAPPPNITNVAASTDGTNVTFSVHVLSDQLASTQGVWITYTVPGSGTWQSIDLTQNAGDPTLWTATQALSSGILFMVQAVNGTGLVSLSTNAGQYYGVGTPPAVTPTAISVSSGPSSGTYDTATSAFTVHLQDNNANPVSSQAVTLQVGGQQALGTTDGSGNASITLQLNQPPGSYPVSAAFAGSAGYGGSSTAQTGTFTINLAPTMLALTSPATGTYGGQSGVVATLTDAASNPVAQRLIVFTVTGNGQTYQTSAITNAGGQARLGVTPLPAGSYSVSAAFGGQIGGQVTESDPDYQSSSASGTVTITPAVLTITASNGTMVYGSNPPAITPSFSGFVNGDTSSSLTTQPTCSTVATSTSPAGQYASTCQGASNPNYSMSYQPGTVTVSKDSTATTASSASATFGQTSVSLSATVANTSSSALVNEGSVTFQLSQNGSSVGTPVTATVSNGSATASYPLPSGVVGTYTITATFKPSTDFNGSSDSSKTLSVTYIFSGYLQPINDPGHLKVCGSPCSMSVFKAGSTIPVKFQLSNAGGQFVQAAVAPTFSATQISCAVGSVNDTATATSTSSGNTFQYDSSGQQYTYNWSTKGIASGTCWSISATLNDGTKPAVTIGLR